MLQNANPVDDLQQVEYNCQYFHNKVNAFEWNSVSNLQGYEDKVVNAEKSCASFNKLCDPFFIPKCILFLLFFVDCLKITYFINIELCY